MNAAGSVTWRWEIASDPDEVHALLCASDAYSAKTTDTPAPVRTPSTTQRLVAERSVHLLRADGRPAGMFTLTWRPSFDDDLTGPVADNPAYLQRLAVGPLWLEQGAIVGAHCMRRAIRTARSAGADAIRAEANPDVTRVRTLLHLFGFRQYGPVLTSDARRRIRLHKPLGARPDDAHAPAGSPRTMPT